MGFFLSYFHARKLLKQTKRAMLEFYTSSTSSLLSRSDIEIIVNAQFTSFREDPNGVVFLNRRMKVNPYMLSMLIITVNLTSHVIVSDAKVRDVIHSAVALTFIDGLNLHKAPGDEITFKEIFNRLYDFEEVHDVQQYLHDYERERVSS